MPYASIRSLPLSARGLPLRAKRIFRAAFNRAWVTYRGDESRVFAVAWAAVKRKYVKGRDGEWRRRR